MELLQEGDPQRIGPYTVIRRLGSGGMGTVYLGRSSGGRTVALKVVRPDLAGQPVFQARFRQEVAAARRVAGAYTAPVVDAAPDASAPWMATAFVPGLSLSDAVAKHGPLSGASLSMLIAGIAEALKSVHAAELIHRDLKPGNVMLALDGPHVIDFGISRAIDAVSLTATDVVVGSPGYMSPEQALHNDLTPASDVFSLAATAFYAATGEGPFGHGTHASLLFRVVGTEPDLAPVSEPLRTLLAECFAKDPAQRPTPTQVVEYIERYGTFDSGGSWLPPQMTAEIQAVRAAISTLPEAPAAPQAHSGALPATTPFGIPQAPSHAPAAPVPPASVPRSLSRRRLLIGAGSALAVAGIGTTAALLNNLGGSSPGGASGGARNTLTPDVPDARARLTKELPEKAAGITLAGDLVVSFSAMTISAIGTDGAPRWGPLQTISTGGSLLANGLVVDRMMYFCGLTELSLRSNGLIALDLTTGAVAWSLPVPHADWFTLSVIGSTGNVVYVSGSRMDLENVSAQTTPGDGFVWAVDTTARRGVWETSGPDIGTLLLAPPPGAPLLAGRSSGLNGSVVTLDPATGARGWHAQVPGGAYLQTGSAFPASCLAAGRFVNAGSKVLAVEAATGKEAWAFDPGTAQPNFRWPVASPDGKTVFVAGEPGLFALNASNGRVRWRTTLAEGSLGADGRRRIQFADGNLYVTDDRSRLWAVDPATGAGRWKYTAPRPELTGTPIVTVGGGRVWIAKDTSVTAIDASGT